MRQLSLLSLSILILGTLPPLDANAQSACAFTSVEGDTSYGSLSALMAPCQNELDDLQGAVRDAHENVISAGTGVTADQTAALETAETNLLTGLQSFATSLNARDDDQAAGASWIALAVDLLGFDNYDTNPNLRANRSVSQADYQSSNLIQRRNYWGERIGLDELAAPDPSGSIQSQLNWLKGNLGVDITAAQQDSEAATLAATGLSVGDYYRSVALSASINDPYVPAGARGSFAINFASFELASALSFGFASAIGRNSRLSISAAVTRDEQENLMRATYSINW
ncbi:MAG: hypothetical protein ACR2PW_05210 [Gammaproteobacteria bacterium]